MGAIRSMRQAAAHACDAWPIAPEHDCRRLKQPCDLKARGRSVTCNTWKPAHLPANGSLVIGRPRASAGCVRSCCGYPMSTIQPIRLALLTNAAACHTSRRMKTPWRPPSSRTPGKLPDGGRPCCREAGGRRCDSPSGRQGAPCRRDAFGPARRDGLCDRPGDHVRSARRYQHDRERRRKSWSTGLGQLGFPL
jgi:hypothetical protein